MGRLIRNDGAEGRSAPCSVVTKRRRIIPYLPSVAERRRRKKRERLQGTGISSTARNDNDYRAEFQGSLEFRLHECMPAFTRTPYPVEERRVEIAEVKGRRKTSKRLDGVLLGS